VSINSTDENNDDTDEDLDDPQNVEELFQEAIMPKA